MNTDNQTTAVLRYDPSEATSSSNKLKSLLPVESDPFAPRFPQRLDELDVSAGFLTDLSLKAVAMESDCTTASVAERLHLGLLVTETLLNRLLTEKFIERTGVAPGLHNHNYSMLERGWVEVKRVNEQNSYVGPAPVSLNSYTDAITNQIRSRTSATRSALEQAMAGLVLSDAAKQTLGLVASSGRSLFLSGPSGNGKTAIARALVNAVPGELWIPHAIEVDRQVIRVFDPHSHQPVHVENNDADRRWVKIRPPLVVVGGELTLDSLELRTTQTQRFYEAPFQLKSNGGVLVVDDLGRQRCSATELLNRWIIPLENRVDYLTLSTGKKIQVPFEQIIIFATNLTGADLTDEAFLRRMGYRIYVMSPGPDTYAEIFTRYARSRGHAVDPNVLPHLEKRYGIERREPKACEPRDLIDRAIEVCKYRREQIRLTKETVDMAWNAYFGASASG